MKRNFLMVLLSAVIAFGLWFYVVTVVSPEHEDTYYQVPVVFDGQSLLTERGLMVTENQNPTVTLTLSGNRTDLNKLNSGNIKVIADLSKISETGEQRLNYTVTYPSNLLSGAVQEVSKDPKYITLTVERQISKEIPVRVSYSGSVPEDFLADKENIVLDYPSVRITGPQPVIDQIEQARVEVDLTDRTESFSEDYRFQLCDREGNPVDAGNVQTDVAQVNLTMKIQRVKEILLTLTVIDGGGATSKTSKIAIEPLTIKVSGSEKVLAELTELNIGTVNLGEITDGYMGTFPIKLPSGVTNLTGVTEAKVVIRFPTLLRKTFTINRITAVNVPSGMEADILTQVLQVTVRGPKELVEKLEAFQLVVTVDFTAAQPGTSTIKAEISLPAGFEEIGAVGTYSVSATLREIVPEVS